MNLETFSIPWLKLTLALGSIFPQVHSVVHTGALINCDETYGWPRAHLRPSPCLPIEGQTFCRPLACPCPQLIQESSPVTHGCL